jgi:sugar transferase (PEP-CTERM/EpsH1 system associated)
MKILWMKAGGLVPLDTGGKIRSYHTLRELARRHEITFHSFYEQHDDDRHESLKDTFARVVTLPLRLPERRGLNDLLLFAKLHLTGQAYTMAKFYTPEVRASIQSVLAEDTYDLLLCDFVAPAGVFPWHLPQPKVLFTHNVEAEVWQRHYQLTPQPAKKLAYWLEYRALKAAEIRYARKADHVLAVSDRNARFFAQYVGDENVSDVPTGVDTEFFQPGPEEEIQPHDLVFTASMDWMPNDDAVHHFVRDLFPLIRDKDPQARFWAVGRRPSDALKSLDNGDSIRITGAVDDIRPYLRQGAVYVMPMRSGSGTRLKIFEAMAAGKAVVSTSVGAEGLPVTDGEDILIADTPEAFRDATLRVVNDASLRNRLGSAARKLADEGFSWKAAGGAFEQILVDLVERHKSA